MFLIDNRDILETDMIKSVVLVQVFLDSTQSLIVSKLHLVCQAIYIYLTNDIIGTLWPLELWWLELRVCSELLLLGLLRQILWCWG